MLDKTCERCGNYPAMESGADGRWYDGMLDFCLVCSQDLCEDCMAEGCCGNVPARSGTED